MNPKSQHIITQLEIYSGAKTRQPNSMMICCPYHPDDTPSMRIYFRSGMAKCYGCKASTTFDDMAPDIGLQPYVHDPMKPVERIRRTRKPKTQDSSGDAVIPESWTLKDLPKGRVWRGFKTEFLSKVGCKLCEMEYGSYVWLPVYINGRLRGYSNGRLQKVKGKTSYINSPGRWTLQEGLFPFDYAINLMRRRKLCTVVLVEGQRDALRLLSLGIPALCIMGSNSWTENKSQILEIAGVEHVMVMMDGDLAGIEATKIIMPTLDGLFATTVVKLWSMPGSYWPKYKRLTLEEQKLPEHKSKLWDPGNVPIEILQQVKNRLRVNYED